MIGLAEHADIVGHALLLGIVAQGVTERFAMRRRQDGQRCEPIRVVARIGPGDGAAPVMADEMKPGIAGKRLREAFDIGEEMADRIISHFGRPRARRIAALVDRHGAKPGRGDWRHDVEPAIGKRRPSVEEEHERRGVVAAGDGVEAKAALTSRARLSKAGGKGRVMGLFS